MSIGNRVGSGLLALGGVVFVALMVYSLALDGGIRGTRESSRTAAEVVVFFPDRQLWHEFRQGVDACVRRKLGKLVAAGEDWVQLETLHHGRRVRFSLNDVRGLRETKEEVQHLVREPAAPIALVGSSNTVLTVALAEALRDCARQTDRGPLLLIPWATAVLAERDEPDQGPVALLGIDPGRTFRFCPNNQSQADLVTHALVRQRKNEVPERVDLIVDRYDPYSVDLADSFHRAIDRLFPNTELVEHGEKLVLPGLWNPPGLPTAAEESLAETIWREAEKTPPGKSHWVVLPLQSEPARRMLLALRRHARQQSESDMPVPLRVLCGDGIGADTLKLFAGQVRFPIWCYSPGSVLVPGAGGAKTPDAVLATDAAVIAEVVASLLWTLDVSSRQPPTADALRKRLAVLDLPAGDPSSLGRALAFAPSGERRGNELGHVLMIEPGESSVFTLETTALGAGSEPRLVPVGPTSDARRP